MKYTALLKETKTCDDCGEGDGPFDAGRVYNEQLNFREIILNDEVKDNLIEKAVIPIMNFNRYDEEREKVIQGYVREPIKILINTSGGSADPCLSLVSTIRSSKTPVHTYALGKAYSAGFLILIAGHMRYAQEFSSIMWHPGRGGYIGSIPSILKNASYLKSLQDRVNGIVADSTFIEIADLEEMCEHEYDWYMHPDEALVRGVIDGILVGDGVVTLDDLEKAVKKTEKKEVKKPTKKPTKKVKE